MDIGIGNVVDIDGDDRPGRKIDAVIAALAVPGRIDRGMQGRRRIEDVGIFGQREVVGDVKGRFNEPVSSGICEAAEALCRCYRDIPKEFFESHLVSQVALRGCPLRHVEQHEDWCEDLPC